MIAACLSLIIGLSLGPLHVCLEIWDSVESSHPIETEIVMTIALYLGKNVTSHKMTTFYAQIDNKTNSFMKILKLKSFEVLTASTIVLS